MKCQRITRRPWQLLEKQYPLQVRGYSEKMFKTPDSVEQICFLSWSWFVLDLAQCRAYALQWDDQCLTWHRTGWNRTEQATSTALKHDTIRLSYQNCLKEFEPAEWACVASELCITARFLAEDQNINFTANSNCSSYILSSWDSCQF